MYGILFLFSFCLRFCWYVACWGLRFSSAYGTRHLFMDCIFIYRELVHFVSFMGLMTSSYFCLLMERSALLAVLQVYFLFRLFIALPIYGVLKEIFCKAVDIVALFIYGFCESFSFCWARQPYSVAQWWILKAYHLFKAVGFLALSLFKTEFVTFYRTVGFLASSPLLS